MFPDSEKRALLLKYILSKNGDREDPGNYRGIYHLTQTEHGDSSFASLYVLIMHHNFSWVKKIRGCMFAAQ